MSAEDPGSVVIPAEALTAVLLDRRCNVCVGVSPPWDGHDKNPMCVGAALDLVRRALDTTVAADTVPVPREWLVRVQAYLLRVEWDAESPEPHVLGQEAGRFLDPGCAGR